MVRGASQAHHRRSGARKGKAGTPWGLRGADRLRSGQGLGRRWPRRGLSPLGQCQLRSAACGTGWSCQPETRDHSEFAFILETSVSRAWGEEGSHAGQLSKRQRGGAPSLGLPGARKWLVGWACLAEEQRHRRFSGHKAGPDSLPVHPPRRLPVSAGSWLCPMGLGERSEACASKGLVETEVLLGTTALSCPTLFSTCEVVSAKKTRAQRP